MTKVRFDMGADFWGQTEERGFAESRAEYNGEVLSILKTRDKVDEFTGPLDSVDVVRNVDGGFILESMESCDDPHCAADDGRYGDKQDKQAHDAPRSRNSLSARKRKEHQRKRQAVYQTTTGIQFIGNILSVCICAVWINEHVIPSLVVDGDDDIKERGDLQGPLLRG